MKWLVDLMTNLWNDQLIRWHVSDIIMKSEVKNGYFIIVNGNDLWVKCLIKEMNYLWNDCLRKQLIDEMNNKWNAYYLTNRWNDWLINLQLLQGNSAWNDEFMKWQFVELNCFFNEYFLKPENDKTRMAPLKSFFFLFRIPCPRRKFASSN
jgi:hypothetical protein